MNPLRLAHLSDIHFASPTLSLTQFLSKRWLGNLNLLLHRKRSYQTGHLRRLPEFLSSLGVEVICLTGDMATTSRDPEFAEGADFVAQFSQPVLTLPGNHDCYTKESERSKAFYRFFPDENLKNQRVTKMPLGKGWWWVGLDCAVATSIIHSNGRFFTEMGAILRRTLEEIPSNERIILGNHFPLITTGRPCHDLARAAALQTILRDFPQVKLYLHGHDHKPYIIEKKGLPLILNCGSCARLPDGTFYLIELAGDSCTVSRYLVSASRPWVVDELKTFALRP